MNLILLFYKKGLFILPCFCIWSLKTWRRGWIILFCLQEQKNCEIKWKNKRASREFARRWLSKLVRNRTQSLKWNILFLPMLQRSIIINFLYISSLYYIYIIDHSRNKNKNNFSYQKTKNTLFRQQIGQSSSAA